MGVCEKTFKDTRMIHQQRYLGMSTENEPNLRIIDTLLWKIFRYQTKRRKDFLEYHGESDR